MDTSLLIRLARLETRITPHRVYRRESAVVAQVDRHGRGRRVREITVDGTRHFYVVAWKWAKLPVFLDPATVRPVLEKIETEILQK